MSKTLKRVELNIPIEIIDMCNLRCKYCYVSAGLTSNDIMGVEDYAKIIKNAITIKGKVRYVGITFTGGEPTMHPSLVDMIHIAKDNNVDRVSLVTNGTLLNKDLLNKMINAGLDWIAISLDSTNEKVNDYLRGYGVYKRVINMLELIKQIDNIYKSLSVTLTNRNISKENAENLVQLALKYNIDAIAFNMLMLEGSLLQNIHDLIPSYIEYLNFIQFLEGDLITKYYGDIEIIIGEPWAGLFDPITPFGEAKVYKAFFPNGRLCSAGITTIGITSNGDVTPCLMLRDKQFIIGNLIKDKLIDLWDNELLSKMRSNLKKICKECEYAIYCGGCFARSYQIFGDAFYADPLCPRNIKYIPNELRKMLKIAK